MYAETAPRENIEEAFVYYDVSGQVETSGKSTTTSKELAYKASCKQPAESKPPIAHKSVCGWGTLSGHKRNMSNRKLKEKQKRCCKSCATSSATGGDETYAKRWFLIAGLQYICVIVSASGSRLESNRAKS